MQIKDQIRVRMDRLGVSYKELAQRVGVSEQTVRFWTAGRSAPKKDRIPLVEQALSVKLDFSEGKPQGKTVAEEMDAADTELFLKIKRLPPMARIAFDRMIDVFLEAKPVQPFIERTKVSPVTAFKQPERIGTKQHAERRKPRKKAQ